MTTRRILLGCGALFVTFWCACGLTFHVGMVVERRKRAARAARERMSA